jgi:large subunit ribosomal protein L18
MASHKIETRARRKKRIRKKIEGTAARPRMSVFRSARHIYVQVVDDLHGTTLASASSLLPDVKGQSGQKSATAKAVGQAIAKACKDKGIDKVVFDRNGFLYHGRIKAVAEGAREGGLSF